MTRLIKSLDASSALNVRTLEAVRDAGERVPSPSPLEQELLALRQRTNELERAVETSDLQIARLREEIEAARRSGWTEGHEVGLKEAADRNTESLGLLEAGIGRAQATFADEIASLDRLAVVLATEGLRKVLSDSAAHAGVLERAIRHQLDQLNAHAIVRVEVSAEDFPDPAALAGLRQGLGRPDLDVRLGSDLKAGGCRIKLVLGEMLVGLDQQWSKLEALLNDMAQPGERR